MSAWSDMMLPKVLLRGLYDKGFYEPMPIQKLVLPAAIKNKANIIGTAQTVRAQRNIKLESSSEILVMNIFVTKKQTKREAVKRWLSACLSWLSSSTRIGCQRTRAPASRRPVRKRSYWHRHVSSPSRSRTTCRLPASIRRPK